MSPMRTRHITWWERDAELAGVEIERAILVGDGGDDPSTSVMFAARAAKARNPRGHRASCAQGRWLVATARIPGSRSSTAVLVLLEGVAVGGHELEHLARSVGWSCAPPSARWSACRRSWGVSPPSPSTQELAHQTSESGDTKADRGSVFEGPVDSVFEPR